MGDLNETDLPGVGVRYDMTTADGRVIGVVVHQTGRRDLVIYDELDPDRAGESAELTEDEGHTLGELLGGSRLVQQLGDAVHRIDDLVISWVRIDLGAPLAGLTLSEASLRTRTGAGVVAIVADSGSTPVPAGSERLRPGDVAVIVGLPEAVEEATGLLSMP